MRSQKIPNWISIFGPDFVIFLYFGKRFSLYFHIFLILKIHLVQFPQVSKPTPWESAHYQPNGHFLDFSGREFWIWKPQVGIFSHRKMRLRFLVLILVENFTCQNFDLSKGHFVNTFCQIWEVGCHFSYVLWSFSLIIFSFINFSGHHFGVHSRPLFTFP